MKTPTYQGKSYIYIIDHYIVFTPWGPQLSKGGEKYSQIEKELISYMKEIR